MMGMEIDEVWSVEFEGNRKCEYGYEDEGCGGGGRGMYCATSCAVMRVSLLASAAAAASSSSRTSDVPGGIDCCCIG